MKLRQIHNIFAQNKVKTRSTPASLPFRGQVIKQTTVKWSIITHALRPSSDAELENFGVRISSERLFEFGTAQPFLPPGSAGNFAFGTGFDSDAETFMCRT